MDDKYYWWNKIRINITKELIAVQAENIDTRIFSDKEMNDIENLFIEIDDKIREKLYGGVK